MTMKTLAAVALAVCTITPCAAAEKSASALPRSTPEEQGVESSGLLRFVEEAEITGQLQHPGVPAVHQIGTLPDVSCLAAIFSASDRKTGGGRVI